MMRLAALIAAAVAACTVATWSPPANALALGEIELQSRLNEPLTARIPLRLSAGDDFQTLRVSVADPEDFERSGLQFDDYLVSLDLTLAPASSAQPAYVLVSSGKIAREPFIDLMVEAKVQGNRVLRNYTILLDPPSIAAASGGSSAAAEPAAVPVPADAPSASYDQPSPAADEAVAVEDQSTAAGSTGNLPSVSSDDPDYFQSGAGWVEGGASRASDSDTAALVVADAAAETGASTYGPIDRQETLWSIAYALRPDASITMDQMQLAIYHANPQAFEGNINRMLSGAMLEIPSEAAIRSIAPAQAKAEVASQRASYSPPTTPRARPATAEVDDDASDAAPEPVTIDQAYGDDFDSAGTADESFEVSDADSGMEAASDFDDAGDMAPSDDAGFADAPDAAPAQDTRSAADGSAQSDRPLTAIERLRAGRNGGDVAAPAATSNPAADTQVAARIDDAPDADEAMDADAGEDAGLVDEASTAESKLRSNEQPQAGAQAEAEAEASSAPPVASTAAPIAASDGDSGGGLPWGIIGALGALLLAGLAFIGLRRRRAAASADDDGTMAVPADADDELPSADDDFEAGDTAILDDEEFGLGDNAQPKQRNDVEPDVPVIDEPDGLTETAILDAEETGADAPADESAATGEAPKSADDSASGEADNEDAMAATMQFDANTISLDLSGDDPISEADVHLAYGATDEAASVMEAAVQSAPDNAAYRNKLAEVYFTGNAVDKFVAHARESESVLKAGSGEAWQKLLILGQQIAPDESLFAQADAPELQSADFDFGSDPDPLEAAADDTAALDIDGPDADADTSDDDGLEFDLGDLDLPGEDLPAAGAADDGEAAADDNSVEFDLGDLDLGGSDRPADASPVEADAGDDDTGLDIDLGGEDTDKDDATKAAEPAAESAEADPVEFDLGEFDLGGDDVGDADSADLDKALGDLGDFDLGDDAAAEPDTASAGVDEASLDALLGDDDSGDALTPDPGEGDDVATKLDLARAYVDMGDKELAESLLKDVAELGDDAQKAEAGELMAKLTGD